MPLWRTWTLNWIVQLALWIFCEKLFTLSMHEEASLFFYARDALQRDKFLLVLNFLCLWRYCLWGEFVLLIHVRLFVSEFDADVLNFGWSCLCEFACVVVLYSLLRWNFTCVLIISVPHACVACKYSQYTLVGSLFLVRFYLGNVRVFLKKKNKTKWHLDHLCSLLTSIC